MKKTLTFLAAFLILSFSDAQCSTELTLEEALEDIREKVTSYSVSNNSLLSMSLSPDEGTDDEIHDAILRLSHRLNSRLQEKYKHVLQVKGQGEEKRIINRFFYIEIASFIEAEKKIFLKVFSMVPPAPSEEDEKECKECQKEKLDVKKSASEEHEEDSEGEDTSNE